MTPKQVIVLLAVIVAILGVTLLATVTLGDDNPRCYSIAELEKDNLEAGGIMAGAAYYEGVNSDTVILIQGKREILAILFKDGCFVAIHGVDLTAAPKNEPDARL